MADIQYCMSVSTQTADDAADEHDERNFVVVKADFFGEAFDGERAVGVELLVAGFVRRFGGVDEVLRGIELRHDAVIGVALHSLFFHLRFRQEGAHFEDRNGGQNAQEQEHGVRNMPMVPI